VVISIVLGVTESIRHPRANVALISATLIRRGPQSPG
jgi:hypothetical protein